MKDRILHIFQETYRELRPRAPMPELAVEFFAFVNINNTIRLREGKLFVRLSDLLEGAPDPVLRAIAHILLAKMYRKPIERAIRDSVSPLYFRSGHLQKSSPRAPDARPQANRKRPGPNLQSGKYLRRSEHSDSSTACWLDRK